MLRAALAKTQEIFSNYKKKIVIILLVSILLILVSMYTYKKYIQPMIAPSYVPNKEFVEEGAEGPDADFVFFYVNWCPHCKSAMPAWDNIKAKYNEKKINNTTVYFREVDCERNEEEADRYNITGYPTIKLLKGDQIIEFNAKPTENSLTQFLHSVL